MRRESALQVVLRLCCTGNGTRTCAYTRTRTCTYTSTAAAYGRPIARSNSALAMRAFMSAAVAVASEAVASDSACRS